MGTGTKGGDEKRNERMKTNSCHGPVGPESSWINIKDIKQTNKNTGEKAESGRGGGKMGMCFGQRGLHMLLAYFARTLRLFHC